jgi:hypothetical protein
MTLFEAPPYDPSREKRKRMIAVILLVCLLVGALLVYHFWNWREERTVNRFFDAIERKDFATAYGIWMADPNWKQHAEKYANYPFGAFELDWGPSGEYGAITRHRVATSITPKGGGSGVVVVAYLNDRRQPVSLWVECKDKSMTFSPMKAVVQP